MSGARLELPARANAQGQVGSARGAKRSDESAQHAPPVWTHSLAAAQVGGRARESGARCCVARTRLHDEGHALRLPFRHGIEVQAEERLPVHVFQLESERALWVQGDAKLEGHLVLESQPRHVDVDLQPLGEEHRVSRARVVFRMASARGADRTHGGTGVDGRSAGGPGFFA